MKNIFYIIALISVTVYLFVIDKTINYKQTEWKKNSPSVIDITEDSIKVCFAVTEPATIYWRLFTNQQDIPKNTHVFTNTHISKNTISFGGNITTGNNFSYTNHISNLVSKQEYFLSTVAVNYIGNFPSKIRYIKFKTL